MKLKLILILLPIAFALFSFSKENGQKSNQVIVGISADIETLNPLYAFSVEECNVVELQYLSLLQSNWDKEIGEISYSPMLAKTWKWNRTENSILVEIRDDVLWSDGVKCSVDDIIFSFDIYSDPKIKSRFGGYFENFYSDKNQHINISKTFEKISDTKLIIKFRDNSRPQLIDIDFPILPKHFFEQFNKEDIPNLQPEKYVTNGAFILDRWDRGGAIILSKNVNSFLVNKKTIKRIIFKVIPTYQNRIQQLITGDIDLMELIMPNDIDRISKLNSINVVPVSGREFDYIGWNNISPVDYNENNRIKPNKFFSSSKVREALTFALDRELIVEKNLKGFGQIANGPISPMFKLFKTDLLNKHEHNLELAKKILKEEGWEDSNGDGTIDKNGVEFSFKMYIPTKDVRRTYAASIFQNNLKSIGIDVITSGAERNIFSNNLINKKYDSWMTGWGIPIPINLKISWFSNLENTQLNYSSYQNEEVDSLLNKVERVTDNNEKIELYKKIEMIINSEQPYSFLYWVDNITAYNNRIKNISITPIGTVHNCWNWTIGNL